MLIKIKGDTELCHIQEIFSGFYPCLKMEFYKGPQEKFETVAERKLICPFQRLSDIGLAKVSGLMQINPCHLVDSIEQEFQERFNLFIQLWRKGKTGWIKTRSEETLTLKQLNELGAVATGTADVICQLNEKLNNAPDYYIFNKARSAATIQQ